MATGPGLFVANDFTFEGINDGRVEDSTQSRQEAVLCNLKKIDQPLELYGVGWELLQGRELTWYTKVDLDLRSRWEGE